MKTDNEEIFAKIKFEGHLVEDGFMDARKSGEALIGIDKALKYFLYQENQSFQDMDFEIPVKIRKGSWETLFPENIDMILIKTSLAWGAAKYFGSALSEMAKNDFKDYGFKNIFKNSFKGMTWVIKLATHLGSITQKKLENVKFSKNNELVCVTNNQNETLWVPVEYVELFSKCPSKLFSHLANVIEEERELVISYNEDGNKENARINDNQKFIFTNQEDDEILFPELEHDSYVELEGYITRGNENSNTIGFFYKNHILTCLPNEGNIKDYKSFLFSNCILKGYVDRLDKNGYYKEKRPRIRFIEIVLIEKEDNNSNKQTELFD